MSRLGELSITSDTREEGSAGGGGKARKRRGSSSSASATTQGRRPNRKLEQLHLLLGEAPHAVGWAALAVAYQGSFVTHKHEFATSCRFVDLAKCLAAQHPEL